MAYERFIDRSDSGQLTKSCPDFVLRRHGIPPSWMVYIFIIVLLLILIMVNYLSITLILLPHDSPTPLNKILSFLVIVSVMLTGVAVFSYSMVHKIREIVLQTEFQNLLFASSASVDTKFCAIVTKGQLIVYYDYNFDQIFPLAENSESILNRLLDNKGVDKTAEHAIVDAVANSKKAEMPLTIYDEDGTSSKISLKIDPLKRPLGHVVIRGYALKAT